MDWYDRSMKELDNWFESGEMTVECHKEYRRCVKNLNRELKETS